MPLTIDFLKANPFLVLDTKFFGQEFKDRLLASFDNLDEQTDGLLIHCDNFQALNLLQTKYRDTVKCLYIDPPFNTGTNDFLYKNDYLDSSWISMLIDRVQLAQSLLSPDGFIFVRIDYHGNQYVRSILDTVFGKENFRSELNVSRIRKNTTGQGRISLPFATDSLFLYSRSELAEYVNPFMGLEKTRESYWRRLDDSAGFRNPPERDFFGKIILPPKRDQHFKYAQTSIDEMISQGRIRLKCKNCGYAHLAGEWQGCPQCQADDPLPQYLVKETDVKILDTNWTDISGYSNNWNFPTENSEVLLQRVIQLASRERDVVMDFFLGSSTTAATAQKMNRRWVGVEMGGYWDQTDLRRLKVVLNGDNTGLRDYERRRSMFKYLQLETYEDTLNNLELKRTEEQASLLEAHEEFREDYMLRYMLDVEARGSASLLNVETFADPFNYQLNIATGASVGETRQVTVDLVETFNYLLGLHVKSMDMISGFRVVEGTNPEGDKVLIIWRNTREKSNDDLDQFFQKQGYTTRDKKFGLIYTNGDNNLENLKRGDETWKVRLIEEEFQRLMFDVQDV